MQQIYLRVKGIIKKQDKYLVLKRWVDDRIPEPFVWEFIDGEVGFGESADDAILRYMHESLGVDGSIEKISYTWSQVMGDTQCIGIAYICSISDPDENITLSEEFGEFAWISKEEFPDYIENMYMLKDLERAKL